MYEPIRDNNGAVTGIRRLSDGAQIINTESAAYADFLAWYADQDPPPFSLDPVLSAMWLPLAVELQSETYSAFSDDEAAAALNARSRRGLVPLWEVDLYRVRNGLTIPLESAKTTHVLTDVRNAAAAALAYLASPHVENIDLDDPDSAAMLLALEQGAVLTADQLQAIDALADNRATRCEQLGLPPATTPIVALARALSPPP